MLNLVAPHIGPGVGFEDVDLQQTRPLNPHTGVTLRWFLRHRLRVLQIPGDSLGTIMVFLFQILKYQTGLDGALFPEVIIS